jgi:phosphate transport system substrate-binding protein
MKIQTSSVVTLSLLAGLVAATPKVLAQAAVETKFPLPTSLPAGTKVKVGGSQSLEGLNKGLQEAFKKKFGDSEVVPTYTSTDKGIAALEKGEADIVGAGRLLTATEQAKGLGVKSLGYEKIAIIVSDKNTFAKDNIGFDQFAKIYRGEIQDWSKVGGTKGTIKVIDQSNTSDTRQAFARYSVFKSGLNTSKSAIKLTDNSAKSVAEKLGTNGIGYLPVSQVKGLSGVKVLSLNKVQPDDARYAFSQPMSYVYSKDKASEGAKALLGVVDSPEGAAAIAAVPGITPITASGAIAPAAAGGNSNASVKPEGTGTTITEGTAAGATATTGDKGGIPWWVWLGIPLALGAGWWALAGGKKKETAQSEPKRLNPLYSENDVKPTGTTGFTTGTTGFTTNRDGQDTGIPLSGDLSLPTNAVDKAGSAIGGAATAAKDQAGDLLKGAALAGGAAIAGGAALAGGLGKGVVDKSASLSGDLSGELPKIDLGNPLEGLKKKAEDLTPDLDLGNPIEGLKDKAGDLGNSIEGIMPDVGNPISGLGDKAGDLLKGAAVAGGAAVVGGAALAGGLFGNKEAEKSDELKADDSSGFSFGDIGQGIQDKVGDVVEGGQDLGGATIAGGAALAGGAAAAATQGAQSLWGSNDDHSGELSLEDSSFETEISALSNKSGDLGPLDLPSADLKATPDPFDDSILSEPSAVSAPEMSGGFNPFDSIGELKDRAVDSVQGLASTGGSAVLGGAAAAAGLAVGAGAAAKSFVTGENRTETTPEETGVLQQEGQITLVSPNPAQAYVHWDVPVKLKRQLRQQGGRKLAVRMYDVTDVDVSNHLPSNFQEFECDELAWDLHLPVPRADRKYLVEIGYVSEDNNWLMLARSTPVMIHSNS